MNRLVLAALLLLPTAAHAGGIFVPGTGPQAQARAGAFVAKADDPTALYHNPAGFAKLVGTVVYIGSNLVDYSLEFTRTGTYEDSGNGESYLGADYPTVKNDASPKVGVAGFQAVPLIAVSSDLGRPDLPIRVGAGLFAPQGFPNREFARSISVQGADLAPGPQRYDAITQKAETAMPSVAVAYSVMDKLDIGVRATWGFAKLEATSATWGIRNYEEWEQKDGVFNLDVSDNFVPAFGFGALFRPTTSFEVGASYHSGLSIRAKGTGTTELGADLGLAGEPEEIEPEEDQFARCEPGGTVDALKACIDLDLPQFATVGARWILRDADGGEKADVEVDVRWENWSAERASEYEVVVDGRSKLTTLPLNTVFLKHDLDDVLSFRLGGSYKLPVGGSPLTLRGGIAYDTAAAPDRFSRVDFDGAARTTVALGAGYEFGGKYRVDLGGGVVMESDRTVEQCLPPDGPDLDDLACDGSDAFTPVADRTRPDPSQPLSDTNSAVESPFNAGTYKSSYLLLSLGFSASF